MSSGFSRLFERPSHAPRNAHLSASRRISGRRLTRLLAPA